MCIDEREPKRWYTEHLLKPEYVEREVLPRASALRTLTALVGSPFGARVPFHVTNLGTELQAEKSTDSWVTVCDEVMLRKKGDLDEGKVHSGSRVRFGKEGGVWMEKTATELLEKAIASTKDAKHNKVVHPDSSKRFVVNATTDEWGDPYVGKKKVLQQKSGNSGRPEDWVNLCEEGKHAEVPGHTLLRFGFEVKDAPGYWTKERYAVPHVQLTADIIRLGFELPQLHPFGDDADHTNNPRVLQHWEDHLADVDMLRPAEKFKPFLQFALEMLTDFFVSDAKGKWSKDQFKQYVLVLKAAMLDNPGKPLLLSKVRGPAGESIYLWAVLMEQFELAKWLLELEPMLFKTRYVGPEYRGENALHILCSKKKLDELRDVAKAVLFYKPPVHPASLSESQRTLWGLADAVKQLGAPLPSGASTPSSPMLVTSPGKGTATPVKVVRGGAATPAPLPTPPSPLPKPTPAQAFSTLSQFKEQLGLQASAPRGGSGKERVAAATLLTDSTNALCILSWSLLFHHWKPIDELGDKEKEGSAGDPKMEAAASKALCGDWMRAAWSRQVNGLAYGSFFEPAELGGTCYYGGTPVAIATVMGDVDTIRFLCMEVGCTDEASWEACRPKVGAAGYKHLYPDSLDPDFTKDGDPQSHRFASSLLKSWDHRRCARLDCADRFGNTAGHMAVSAHPSADMFAYLQSLYQDGYGRCALYYFMEERERAKAAQKAALEAAQSSPLCLVVTPLSEESALCGNDWRLLAQAVWAAVQSKLNTDGLLAAGASSSATDGSGADDGGTPSRRGGGGGGGGGGSLLTAAPEIERCAGRHHGETRLRIPLLRASTSPIFATDKIVAELADKLEWHCFPNAGAEAHTSLSPPKPITAIFTKDGIETSETLHLGLNLRGHATVAAAVRCALAGSCVTACTQKVNSCTSVLCPLRPRPANSTESCYCEPMVNEINLAAGDDQGQTTFSGWRRPAKFPVGVPPKNNYSTSSGDDDSGALQLPVGAQVPSSPRPKGQSSRSIAVLDEVAPAAPPPEVAVPGLFSATAAAPAAALAPPPPPAATAFAPPPAATALAPPTAATALTPSPVAAASTQLSVAVEPSLDEAPLLPLYESLPKDLKDIVNREGLTPLTLAVRRGKRDMFEDLCVASSYMNPRTLILTPPPPFPPCPPLFPISPATQVETKPLCGVAVGRGNVLHTLPRPGGRHCAGDGREGGERLGKGAQAKGGGVRGPAWQHALLGVRVLLPPRLGPPKDAGAAVGVGAGGAVVVAAAAKPAALSLRWPAQRAQARPAPRDVRRREVLHQRAAGRNAHRRRR